MALPSRRSSLLSGSSSPVALPSSLALPSRRSSLLSGYSSPVALPSSLALPSRRSSGFFGFTTGARRSRGSSMVAPQPRKMKIIGLFLLVMAMMAKLSTSLQSFTLEVKQELDSNKKLVIFINGKTPGPPIQVHRGETVMVRVINNLENKNLAIRWNGLRQIGTPSCGPISAGEACTYRFIADRVGSYSYESQYRMQKDTGLYGPIRVLP